MLLTDEQKKQLEKALLDKWIGSLKCPICQGTEWVVNTNIFEIPDFQGTQSRSIIPRNVFPVIIIICDRCSHSIFFSAMKLGLLKTDEGEKGSS